MRLSLRKLKDICNKIRKIFVVTFNLIKKCVISYIKQEKDELMKINGIQTKTEIRISVITEFDSLCMFENRKYFNT